MGYSCSPFIISVIFLNKAGKSISSKLTFAADEDFSDVPVNQLNKKLILLFLKKNKITMYDI